MCERELQNTTARSTNQKHTYLPNLAGAVAYFCIDKSVINI